MENQQKLQLLDNPYLNFCYSIADNSEYMEDFRLIYKVWVLYDIYHIASTEIKDTIKQSLDKEIQNVTSLSIKRLLETAFIFANLDTEKLTTYLSEGEKEGHIEKIDDLKNQAYRIAISICYYGRYLKEIWEQEHIFFDNTVIIYRLFTRLWILTKARDEKIDEDIDIFSLDFHWKIEATRKEMKNRFSIADLLWIGRFKEKFWEKFKWFLDDEVFFSDFQTEVMQSLIEPIYEDISWNKRLKSTAISAPTSAGKTFIIKKYIIYKILEAYLGWKNINIAFIVPSKALLNELKNDFAELFKNYNISEDICHIHTHLLGEDFIENYKKDSNLFIFTQERLNYFYNDVKYKDWWRNFKLNITVVDEAHKVWYGYRWTLLSYIISKIKKDNEHVQLILLAPLLSKLHKFKKEFWLELLEERFSNFWIVAKNEIFVKQKWKKWIYQISFFIKFLSENIKLCEYEYRKKDSGRMTLKIWLTIISRLFSEHEMQSIIFRFGIDAVKEQAESVCRFLDHKEYLNANLVEYINDTLPTSFWLSEELKLWVAYHNWWIPTYIKTSIEIAFKNNAIKYLCANHTLLEWVNLPAKNIFVGIDDYKREQITTLDKKNLIWRSGRLNEHLSGNVFFVNFKDKEIDEMLNGEDITELENNTSTILDDKIKDADGKSKFDRFLEYINSDEWCFRIISYANPIYDKEKQRIDTELKDFEYMTGYLISKFIEIKQRWGDEENEFIKKIGYFIYEFSEIKKDKLYLLRDRINILYKDIDEKSHGNSMLFQIIQKNIFIDPRKQLRFYLSIINGENTFLIENIKKYSEIILLLTNKTILGYQTKDYWDTTHLQKITKKWQDIKELFENVQEYFVRRYNYRGNMHYSWDSNGNLLSFLNRWIFAYSLIEILGEKNTIEKLKLITNEIQFNYLNAFSIYFEIANVAYKEYMITSDSDVLFSDIQHNDEPAFDNKLDFPTLDMNFLYYMEIWTFFPNLVYLISKWVSRESAIWLKDNDNIIQTFPWEKYNQNSQSYFNGEKERILHELGRRNKLTMKEELERYIYN